MKNWKIPVTWQVYGFVYIEANTLAEALEIARDDEGNLPLPIESDYIEKSWKLWEEDVENVRSLYNNNEKDEMLLQPAKKKDDK